MASGSFGGGSGGVPASRRRLVFCFFSLLMLWGATAWAETDISASVQVNRGRSFYDYAKSHTYLAVSIKNTSTKSYQKPLKLVIAGVTPAEVTVANPSGSTGTGKPYLDFSNSLGDGILASGETSAELTLRFSNPKRLRFDFTTSVLAEILPPPNAAPVLSPVPPITLDEGAIMEVGVSATDPDRNPLVLSAANLPAFARFTDKGNGTGTLSLSPDYTQAGNYTLTLTASDGSLSDARDVTITVVNVNRPPKLTSTPVPAALEGQAYTYQVTAQDPDQDVLEFRLLQAPEGMAVNSASGLVSWTPSAIDVGIHEVSLTVRDALGASDGQTYSLTVAPTVDRAPPVVAIFAPAQAQTSTPLNIEAKAADNVGVSKIAIYVDRLLVKEMASPPYRIPYTAPDQAGGSLSLRAVAFDEAGNQGEATGSILVVDTPDTTPPLIEAVFLPPSAAPGERVSVSARVTDNRGVGVVRFSCQGSTFGAATIPPFEAVFAVPANAPVGGTLLVDVLAEDASGNPAQAQGSIRIVATPDAEPPNSLSLQAPTQAVAGQTVQLNASAVDAVAVFKVVFYADGCPVAEDFEPPYQALWTLPETKLIGSQAVFLARAFDFAGNRTDAPPRYTLVVAPEKGFVVGSVYDDTTGLPLAGAVVAVTSLRGKTPAPPIRTTTDAAGRYRLELEEGEVALEITKTGFTASYRTESAQAGAVVNPLDARLTPVASGHPINQTTGGNLRTDNNRIGLYVQPGAFLNDLSVALTKLSLQGLPAPLPLGWAPVCAVAIGPEDKNPAAPLELSIRGQDNLGGSAESALSSLVAARWDKERRKWVRIQTSALSGEEGLLLAMPGMGVAVLTKPDLKPSSPSVPELGGELTGVPPQSIQEGTTASVLPSPKVIFLQPGAKSNVSAVLNNAQPLPSGTRIQVDFSETYQRTDNARLNPASMTQDFLLYQGTNTFESRFAASPSESFDPSLLREGVITLNAHRPSGTDGTGIIGPAGGTITSPLGVSLTFPPGAAASRIPVAIAALNEPPPGLEGDNRFTFVGGALVDLGEADLATPCKLTLNLDLAPPAGVRLLALRTVRVEGTTRLELIGLPTVSGKALTLETSATGLPFSGIVASGRIYLVATNLPLGYVTGSVQSDGKPPEAGVVAGDGLPFVSLLGSSRPSYVLASPLGSFAVSGKDLKSGSSAVGAVSIAAADEIALLDLSLSNSRPVVASVSPGDGATGVQTAASVAVRFSREMDGSSISSSTFTISSGGTQVQGTVTLLADKLTAVFGPSAPLADSSLFQVKLASSVRDGFGQLLKGNQADGSFVSSFTTVDITPPKRPEAGQVAASYTQQETLSITGTQGSAEPGVIVTATNTATGETTSVLAGSDGSFILNVKGKPGESIDLNYRDSVGNETSVPVSVPVVLQGLMASPAAVTFLEFNRTQTIIVKAFYSDGSAVNLDPGLIQFQSASPQVAAVSSEGMVIPLTDGKTIISASFGQAPFRYTANIPTYVKTQGEVIVDQVVGPQGVSIQLDDGFSLSIPEGALSADTPITIAKIAFEEPVAADIGGTVKVISGYRFTPDVNLSVPIEMQFPYPDSALDLIGEAGSVMVFASESASFENAFVDSVSDSEGDAPSQFNDRSARRVVVETDHFSHRFVAVVGGYPMGIKHTSGTMKYGDVSVPFFDHPGIATGTHVHGSPPTWDNKKNPNTNTNIVLHATNSPVRTILRIESSSFGTKVRFSVTGICTKSQSNCRDIGFDENYKLPYKYMTIYKPNNYITIMTGSADGFILRIENEQFPLEYVELYFSIPVSDTSSIPINTSWINATIIPQPFWGKQDSDIGIIKYLYNPQTSAGAHFIITQKGYIGRYFDPIQNVPHSTVLDGNSTGIELINTGHHIDFYTGPQMDATLQLCDYLSNQYRENILTFGSRGAYRDDRKFSIDYSIIDRDPLKHRTPEELWMYEAVLTHREVDRDLNRNRPGTANGTDWRKADPYGPTFDAEFVTAGLRYDFPGLIDTRGGDLLVAQPNLEVNFPGKGGNVEIKYGIRPSDDNDTQLGWNAFAGLPGSTSKNPPVENLVIKEGEEPILDNKFLNIWEEYQFANLIVRGKLLLKGDTTIRVSGTLYVSPTGSIIGRKQDDEVSDSNDGKNLVIYAAGPVILHGLVDLSGMDAKTIDESGGNGGNLTILSRAYSPLQIPTIVTQGGDVMTMPAMLKDQNWSADFGKGGDGGDVTIQGPPNGLIVFSGIKKTPEKLLENLGKSSTDVTACDYVDEAFTPTDGMGRKLPGMKFPIDTISHDRDAVSQVSHASLYPAHSLFFKSHNTPCKKVSSYCGHQGLVRTQGKGIVTSGGTGASVGTAWPEEQTSPGAPGGDGGKISVSFPQDGNGTIRFRGVIFLTGTGTGLLEYELPVVYARLSPFYLEPTILSTGSAGGKGSTPQHFESYTTMETIPPSPGDLYLLQFPLWTNYSALPGGNGGSGGRAGKVTFDKVKAVYPKPTRFQRTDKHFPVVYGFDSAIPKDPSSLKIIGTVCSYYEKGNLELFSLVVDGYKKAGEDCLPASLLGGSGGLAGGSELNDLRPPKLFEDIGTAGKYGPKGASGTLTPLMK